MTKIFESELNGWDETAEALIVYELEEGEYDDIYDEYEDELGILDYERMLLDLGHYDIENVMPGARYERYYVERITTHHLVVSVFVGLNV